MTGTLNVYGSTFLFPMGKGLFSFESFSYRVFLAISVSIIIIAFKVFNTNAQPGSAHLHLVPQVAAIALQMMNLDGRQPR